MGSEVPRTMSGYDTCACGRRKRRASELCATCKSESVLGVTRAEIDRRCCDHVQTTVRCCIPGCDWSGYTGPAVEARRIQAEHAATHRRQRRRGRYGAERAASMCKRGCGHRHNPANGGPYKRLCDPCKADLLADIRERRRLEATHGRDGDRLFKVLGRQGRARPRPAEA